MTNGTQVGLDTPDSVGWFAFEGRFDLPNTPSTFRSAVEVIDVENSLEVYVDGSLFSPSQLIGKFTRLYLPWEAPPLPATASELTDEARNYIAGVQAERKVAEDRAYNAEQTIRMLKRRIEQLSQAAPVAASVTLSPQTISMARLALEHQRADILLYFAADAERLAPVLAALEEFDAYVEQVKHVGASVPSEEVLDAIGYCWRWAQTWSEKGGADTDERYMFMNKQIDIVLAWLQHAPSEEGDDETSQ